MGMFGLDEETRENEAVNGNEEMAAEEEVKKRLPFAVWEVSGKEYRLKLKSKAILRLEEKFRNNLLNALTGQGIPPLGVMLTTIQAAAQEYNHKLDFAKVQELYDQYVENGGTQLTLYMDVIMPILEASGFFTLNQAETMNEKLDEVKDAM